MKLALFISLVLIYGFSSFASNDEEASSISEDEKKCFMIANQVCGTAENLEKCVNFHPNDFPSYCKEEVVSPYLEVQNIGNSQGISSCTEALGEKCKLELPEAHAKPNRAAIELSLKKYQSCMNDQAELLSQCKSIIDKEADANTSADELLFQRVSK